MCVLISSVHWCECLMRCKKCVKLFFVVSDSLREELCLWICEIVTGNVIFLVISSVISGLAECSVHFSFISSSHLNGFQSKHPDLLQGEFLFCLFPVQWMFNKYKNRDVRGSFSHRLQWEKKTLFLQAHRHLATLSSNLPFSWREKKGKTCFLNMLALFLHLLTYQSGSHL